MSEIRTRHEALSGASLRASASRTWVLFTSETSETINFGWANFDPNLLKRLSTQTCRDYETPAGFLRKSATVHPKFIGLKPLGVPIAAILWMGYPKSSDTPSCCPFSDPPRELQGMLLLSWPGASHSVAVVLDYYC